MHERLIDINAKPGYNEAVQFFGAGKELFENIDNFLVNEIKAEKGINFSAHDKCWGIDYNLNNKLICGIYFEKDSVFAVVKFSLAKDNVKNFDSMYNSLSPYAKTCVDNSPWRHVGFVEYRILNVEHIDDLYKMIKYRANEKQKGKTVK